MFWHIFRYRMKCALRDRVTMFWTLLFPIVLAIFFNMAFSNLSSHELFNSIPFAVVDNAAYQKDPAMQDFLKHLSSSQENTSTVSSSLTVSSGSAASTPAATAQKPLFQLQTVSKEKADSLLESGGISGYLDLTDGMHLFFKSSGMNQTIIKSVFDQYTQNTSMVTAIMKTNPDAIQKGLIDSLNKDKSPFQSEPGSPVSPDNTVIYFYTIIAMACFYGGFLGMREVNAIQADQSPQAARINVAPTRKLRTFLPSIAAASLIQLTSILLLLAFLVFVVKVDFGSQIAYILLLCLSGCIMGVSFGTMIGALVKGGEGIKIGILIGTSMTLSFFAGMMYVQVKYLITSAVPAMAYLNPLNVITDGFYALYYYQTHTRYFTNLAVLWAFTILFSAITILRLRRLKYASI